ncbi:hypothetical protein BX661DRAFT_183767 [Kickxella alabastrina]|uniref:uncharacterized protein n=1 Tax=Kickxella alabastrina TaxID=61397 RepID=UPI00221F01CF|nr:uncharacterized protein BX661DRAFT_183767 [Kickxella alabastrina]KAI7826306.1 hypothetical protein BX661DRAFT_183767 [Kickxella alabastrina]
MADDDWHTVPEKTAKRPQRGSNRSANTNTNTTSSGSAAASSSQPGLRSRSRPGARRGDDASAAPASSWRTSRPPASRSRSRAPPAPGAALGPGPASAAPAAPGFRLETANKFQVHVGKGSRARRNDELREFFETRDDDSQEEEAFDAIDDADLDVSAYESEDSQDEATHFDPVPLALHCSLCAGRPALGSQPEAARHLRDAHRVVFRQLNHMSLMLQPYIDAWADAPALLEAVAPRDDGVRVVGPDACEADRLIRDRVQRAALDSVLAAQAAERQGVAQRPRKCLFCKHTGDTRQDVFRHAYREHNFNIGLADNLVDVEAFLAILERKLAALQCLYCEKTFTSPAVLRKHMRKKKHFKISAHNRLYDRFYVINYAEPGKSWEALEKEGEADSDVEGGDRKDDSWADWDDNADVPARALFGAQVCASAEECWALMRGEFQLDIRRIRKDAGLDFYRTVSLINHIRRTAARNTCYACSAAFDDQPGLVAHARGVDAAHWRVAVPEEGAAAWDDKASLRPVLENDPLLTSFDDDEDGDEEADEDASGRRLEASKRALREGLDHMALDSTRSKGE